VPELRRMNTIHTDQNSELQLARLAAQRQLYADAKQLYLGELIVGVPAAIGLAGLAIWKQEKSAIFLWGCLFLLLLIDAVVIIPKERWLRTRAARIQEAFDCDVLRLIWREPTCGPQPTTEFVLEQATRFKAHGGDETKLPDWYPKGVEVLPLYMARLVCQRTNCWWDASQRRRYAWTEGVALLALDGLLLFGLGATGVLEKLGAAALAPLIPSAYFAVRQFFEHQRAARSIDILREFAERIWKRMVAGELSESEATRCSTELQDAIFAHRRRSPSIIDWLYFRLRSEYEMQMNKGANVMIEEAQRAMPPSGSSVQVEGMAAIGDSNVANSGRAAAASPAGDSTVPSLGPGVRSGQDPLIVLCVATEWASGRGGLSTFNRELAQACARAGHRVFCFVPSASAEDAASARAVGVELVTARATPGVTAETRLLQRPSLPLGIVPDVIVGHGRVTGPAAKLLAEEHFAGVQRIHVLHMAPGAIEWFKDQPADQAAEASATQKAEARERLEVGLASSAHLVAAVGPLLTREFGTLLHRDGVSVTEILPGLPNELQAEGPAPAHQCLVLGRAEDLSLKGLDIAARAVALVAERRPGFKVRLMVRGAPQGSGDELRKKMISLARRPGLDVRVREYTSEADRIADDIRQSSVVLMPSRSEGFGLVGLEAISMGVPVLLSEKSGLAEAIERDAHQLAERHIATVTGDLEADAVEWARRIEFILDDRDASFSRARQLREAISGAWSWSNVVERLLARAQGRAHAAPASR